MVGVIGRLGLLAISISISETDIGDGGVSSLER